MHAVVFETFSGNARSLNLRQPVIFCTFNAPQFFDLLPHFRSMTFSAEHADAQPVLQSPFLGQLAEMEHVGWRADDYGHSEIFNKHQLPF